MPHTRSQRALTAAAALALCTALRAQQVWIVDQAGAPGAQFTDIQPAVEAAHAGDTVLVRDGAYSGFALVGKGLCIVAAHVDTAQIAGTIAVEDVPAGQIALLRGLRVHAPVQFQLAPPERHALSAVQIAGSLWIEDCVLFGADIEGSSNDGGAGASLQACADVAFVRCELHGGRGGNAGSITGSGELGSGGHALHASDSSLRAVQSSFLGGQGALLGSAELLANGGAAVLNQDGTVELAGCTLQGGQGGTLVAGAGPGGDASWTQGAQAITRLAGGQFLPGAGGLPGYAPGLAIHVDEGASALVLAPSAGEAVLESPAIALVGQAAQLHFELPGASGSSFAFAIVATDDSAIFHQGLGSVLLASGAATVVGLGSTDALGHLTVHWTVPGLPPSVAATQAWVQLGALAPLAPTPIALAAPAAITLAGSQ